MHAQAGFSVVAAMLALFSISAALLLGTLQVEDQARGNREEVEQRAYIEDASRRLTLWYQANANTQEAIAGQLDMAAALAGAGIVPRYGLVAASSQQLSDGMVSWHVLALWLPDPQRVQGTALDPVTGVFTPGTLVSTGQPATVVSATINGRAMQLAAFSESSRRVRLAAARLENMFAARRAMDPFSLGGRNWFRAGDCGAVLPGELPCYDAYTNLAATTAPAEAGIEAEMAVNAWGLPITLSNLQSSSLVTPFSMSVRTLTPWGGVIGAIAKEP